MSHKGRMQKKLILGIKRSTNLLTSGLGGESTWRAGSIFFHSKGYHKLGSVGLDSRKPNFLMKPHLSVVLVRTHQWGNDGWCGVRKNGNQRKVTEQSCPSQRKKKSPSNERKLCGNRQELDDVLDNVLADEMEEVKNSAQDHSSL